MFPMEALSSSTVGAATTRSASSGLILILNFFLWSSSSSDSSEEKNGDFLVTGSDVALRKRSLVQHPTHLPSDVSNCISADIYKIRYFYTELFCHFLAQGAGVNMETLESELQPDNCSSTIIKNTEIE